MAGQWVELLMGLALFLDLLEGKVTVEITPMCVLGREIGFVLIPCVVILTLQGGTIVTAVIGLAMHLHMHLLEVLGGLIPLLHRSMLLLDAILDLRLTALLKGH